MRRRLAAGLDAGLSTALVVATIVVLIGVAGDRAVRFDLSADGVATLQPETVALLSRLDADDATLTVTAFSSRPGAQADSRDARVRDLLDELGARSGRVRARFVDFDADRLTAEALGVRDYGTVVVEARGDRVDLLARDLFRRSGGETVFHGEALVVRAASQVLSGEPRTVYLLRGHGERRVADPGPTGLSELATVLERHGVDVRELDLLRDAVDGLPSVPDDASAVLVVGPDANLAPVEESALRGWLARGGGLGLFLEPHGAVPDVVEEAGARLPSGTVHDRVAVLPHADRPLLSYGEHPITASLRDDDLATLVAGAAPVVVSPESGLSSDALLVTSPSGWIERGSERPAVYDPGVDGGGPVVVGAAMSLRPPHPLALGAPRPPRVVVTGDADWAGSALLREAPGNATFLVNTVRWLTGDDTHARVGRPERVRRLAIGTAQLAAVRWFVLLGLPLLPALAGLAVHLVRRSR